MKMPKLGLTMTKGKVTKWLKKEGESTTKGEPLLEVMTEKITIKVESPGTGTLAKILVPLQKEVPIGTPLAIIAAAGEAVAEPVVATAAAGEPEKASSGNGRVLASPAARQLAKKFAVDLALVTASGKDGRVSVEDVENYVKVREAGAAEPAAEGNVSGAAARLAQERGVDIARVVQQVGNDRRITTDDILNFLEDQEEAVPTTALARRTPFAGLRQVIADRMMQSLHGAAQLTTSMEVDVGELVALRERLVPGFQAGTGIRLTYTDLLIKLVGVVLKEHPIMNSSLEGDEIVLHEDVHMGMAVALEDGLIVPVLRKVHEKSLGQIAQDRVDLADRAQKGQLGLDEIQGSTFTITNLGSYDQDVFTPIINPPESAILGLSRIVKRPVVVNDEIVIRPMMWLNLTFDHRVIDGAPAARFLQSLGKAIANPAQALGL